MIDNELEKKFEQKLIDIKGNNFEILTPFIDFNTPMEFYHKTCNHKFIKDPRSLFKIVGDKCPYCSKSKRRTYESFLYEIEEKRGNEFKLLTDNYKNNKQKMEFYHTVCKQKFEMRVDCFLRGDKCPKCQKKYGNQLDTNKYKEKIEDLYGNEYELIGGYRGKAERITLKHHCKDGEECIFSTYAFDFLHKGRKCPKCFAGNHVSKGELELIEFVKSIYRGKIETSKRGILDNNQELDIYIDEFKLAIEYDGLYYHSDMFKDDKYHYNKYIQCYNKGIKLIHIFEDEWLDKSKNKILKRKIKYLLHQSYNLKKIYARKCYIKEVDSTDASKFLDKYHIQGNDKSNIKLGAFTKSPKTNKEILVSVMTFSKPRIFLGKNSSKKYDYELSRFASRTDYIVIGTFGKMLKYFKDNYSWNTLVTYADRRISSGDIYFKTGWEVVRENKANYYYTDFKKRYNRSAFMKGKIKERFPEIYNENLTERELMYNAGYYRIYDCGTITFKYER